MTVKSIKKPKLIPRKYRPNGQCYCRCGRRVDAGGYWAPGHDVRAMAALDTITAAKSLIDRLTEAGFHFEEGWQEPARCCASCQREL